MAGCCLHIVHIAAEKGAVCLSGVVDVLVDIFHYFKESVKRQCEFANMQELFDVGPGKYWNMILCFFCDFSTMFIFVMLRNFDEIVIILFVVINC